MGDELRAIAAALNTSKHISDAAADNLQKCVDACRGMARLDLVLAEAQDRAYELEPHQVAEMIDRLRFSVRTMNAAMTAFAEYLVDLAATETLPGLPTGDGSTN